MDSNRARGSGTRPPAATMASQNRSQSMIELVVGISGPLGCAYDLSRRLERGDAISISARSRVAFSDPGRSPARWIGIVGFGLFGTMVVSLPRAAEISARAACDVAVDRERHRLDDVGARAGQAAGAPRRTPLAG